MFSDQSTVSMLRMRLLGGFGVERAGAGGTVSHWERRSAKTLTKLLAAQPSHALHREQIIDILWPDADTESSLNSFGKAVHAARHALEPELPRRSSSTYMRLEDSMLALDTDHVAIDADQFEQEAQDALRRRDVPVFESALAVYRGELLPEDRYEDWCAERRNFLAELHGRVLLALADELERHGAFNESADRLREVLQQDPTKEEVHRHLMRLYVEMGTSDLAVRQFHRCATALRQELGLPPQHETELLYYDILASRIPPRTTGPIAVLERADPPGAPLAEPTGGKPLIGREPVLRHLCQQLTRRDDRRAGMILVSGEAGVGKTRLLEELAAEAGRLGALVLWGGGGAHAHQFAWGPLAVALEGYAASRPEAERDELALCYPPLAGFVPSLGIKSQFPLAAGPADHPQDLIPAIVRLLTDLARKQPVLIVLGDLHDADLFSLDLLRYLAQLAVKRPWLMVGAAREEEMGAVTELGRMIEATMRERLCLKIDLGCLSRADCDLLVRGMFAGQEVDDKVAGEIYQWSRGNPLFVEELVQEMREDALGWGGQGEPARVPPRIRALTTMRLAHMDETSRRVLGLAAAIHAGEFSLSKLLTGAAALEPPVCDAALFDVLDQALQTGLLEERTTGYAFRHPLIRTALYESLSRHRRDQLEGALGRC